MRVVSVTAATIVSSFPAAYVLPATGVEMHVTMTTNVHQTHAGAGNVAISTANRRGVLFVTLAVIASAAAEATQ